MGTLNLKTIFSIFLQKQAIWNLKNKTTPKQTNNNKKKKKKPALISEQSYNLKSLHQDMNMTDQVTEHLSCYTGRCLTTAVQCKSDSLFTQLGIYITEELKSHYGCNNP